MAICVAFVGCTNNDSGAQNQSDSVASLATGSITSDAATSNTSATSSATLSTPASSAQSSSAASVPTLPVFGKVGILGDSYSTYKGYIPEGNAIWYGLNGDGSNAAQNNLYSVTQTWWYSLIEETDSELVLNESYSGSAIAYKGYGSLEGSKKSSYIVRAQKSFSGANKPQLDTIFIFGGLNDQWSGTSLGEIKYSDWTEKDLESTLPAFCYLLDMLKKEYPNARIVNITCDELNVSIKSGMTAACLKYNVDNIVLSGISKENGHPNISGMEEIKKQIKKFYNN